jgi:hypothetical protein
MASERNSTSPVVTQAETALRSLGVRDARFNQRLVGRGNFFADWAGRLAGSDVYIGITGKTSASRKVRLLLDDWIFDDVVPRDLGGVLTDVFSGGAVIRRKRSLLVFPAQVLKASAGRSRYSAMRRLPPDEELSPWERALVADSGR